ncbi:MAG: KpsF/GutQ family sugar-phosphate isomerase [Thermodesulfobacteriota bacterium]
MHNDSNDPANAPLGCAGQTDWLALGREVLDAEIEGLQAVRASLGASFVAAVAMLAECTGRVVVTGLGKSGLVGRKIAATLSSTGTPAYFLHPVEGAHGDMGLIRQGDVVLALSNSGETDELNAILPTLRSLGARLIAVTSDPHSRMAQESDVVLQTRVPREACPLGLAPTASTTAALAVGDALAVCLLTHRSFDSQDFKRYHPGGTLGRRLRLCVRDLMHTQELPVVPAGAPLPQALEVLNRGGLGTVVVVDEAGRISGVLTDGDVRRLVCSGGLETVQTVDACMTRQPSAVRAEQSAAEALDLLEQKAITVLPAVNEAGHLCGIIHLHDLLGKGRLRFA